VRRLVNCQGKQKNDELDENIREVDAGQESQRTSGRSSAVITYCSRERAVVSCGRSFGGRTIMTSTARKPLTFPLDALPRVPVRPLKMPSVARSAPLRVPADQKLVERVRREFCDMRGLSPTGRAGDAAVSPRA
jgi:hypothetical protein